MNRELAAREQSQRSLLRGTVTLQSVGTGLFLIGVVFSVLGNAVGMLKRRPRLGNSMGPATLPSVMRSLYHRRIEGLGGNASAWVFGSPKVEQVERAVELFGLGAAALTGWSVGSSVGASVSGLVFGEPHIGSLVGGAVGAFLAEALSRKPRRILARAVAGRASVTGGGRVKAQGHKGAVGRASVSGGGTVRSKGERP